MFSRLFPQRGDNSYRGHKLALWFFALVVLLRAGMSGMAIFNGNMMASSGDGIPLATLTSAGAQAVVSLFAVWGQAHLMICLLGLFVLIRYRTLVPLMFALLLLEHLSRGLILHFLPMSATASARESPGISPIPYGFLVLVIIGLALSLHTQYDRQYHE